MIIILRGIIILLLAVSLSNADNNTIEDEASYIDQKHKLISETIIKWSNHIDMMVSNWLKDDETNTTAENNETNKTRVVEVNTTADNNKIITTTVVEVNTARVSINTPVVRGAAVGSTATVPDISPNVHENSLEDKVNYWLEDKKKDATNTVDDVSKLPADTLEDQVNYLDAFFQSDKYLEETDNTYIRARSENFFQSKESADFGFTLSAQIPFTRSKKNLKIFIEDVTTDNADNILQDNSESPRLGVHYFRPEKYGINSKYSLGLSGIDPYGRARYVKYFRTNDWLIDLSQAFQYSIDDKFEEETNIYFDKKLEDMRLFRIHLHRSTHQEIDGMDYAMSLQYYCCRKKNTGLRFSQTFIGNTEYPYIVDNGIEPLYTKTYGGINNYVTTIAWRRNVWRKWFYYEVRPAVSFHKEYDYDPNYTIRLFFDVYFGKFN